MATIKDQLQEFYSHLIENYHIGSIGSLLSWDQQVNMPSKAAEDRASQMELIDKLSHERATDPKFLNLTDRLYDQIGALSSDDKINVYETKRMLDRQRKLPTSFISERSNLLARSYVEWSEARPQNDFERIKPFLIKIVDFAKQECDLVGYTECPYDALLDIYEPYAKISTLRPLLISVAEELSKIIPLIQEKVSKPDNTNIHFDTDKQYALCKHLMKDLGFPLDRGRLDKAPHPFQTKIGWNDLRITTRYDTNDFLSAVSSTLHELGHAFYEMNLLESHKGTPLGQAISLGIHESQSRLWENIIGRSREYSSYLFNIASHYFPELKKSSSPEKIWLQNNYVAPSLIRVDADEVTYTLHIVIRMILEEELINGRLCIEELPDAWNAHYQKYLGIAPNDYKDGVMQDVHWFSGAFGYFPTYALGNLYGAIFIEKALLDIPDLYSDLEQSGFSKLLAWLRSNIHEHGMRYSAEALVEKVSGKKLSSESFVNYIKTKFEI